MKVKDLAIEGPVIIRSSTPSLPARSPFCACSPRIHKTSGIHSSSRHLGFDTLISFLWKLGFDIGDCLLSLV
ncbi:hypothetical protein RchiOBHm_Chr6g0280361 [Rosa chinensis]|uniref:Uncharacterized protein n=1 Tax=Rosa chinensis TaxID=74649 RepID=A0A2P6PT77_ROSCH|nr:hypothetical protein RchiOBHm_Chr6g0280361 [Rosa chinensis]